MLEKQRMALSRRRRLKALRWADFALADARGGDVVSLAAYLGGTGQREAAERLAAMLGIGERDGR